MSWRCRSCNAFNLSVALDVKLRGWVGNPVLVKISAKFSGLIWLSAHSTVATSVAKFTAAEMTPGCWMS